MKKLRAHFVGLLLTAWTLAANSRAADYVVHITTSYRFSPKNLSIAAGDTVTWINDDELTSYRARSTTGLWDTGTVDWPNSVTLSFNTAGSFPYREPTYYILGMTGTITVTGVAPPSPALLVDARSTAGGAFAFTLTNLTVGKTTVIERSTNCVNWSAISTNVPPTSNLDFTNAANGTAQFFRCYQLP